MPAQPDTTPAATPIDMIAAKIIDGLGACKSVDEIAREIAGLMATPPSQTGQTHLHSPA